MFLQIRTGILRLVAGALLCAVFAMPAYSQKEAAQPAEDESWRDKSERQLRRELRDAEKAFFDAFNDVNSDRKYDVLCKTSTSLGTRKRERKCQARFLWDYEEEMAENYARRSVGAPGPGAAASSNLQPELDALRAEMSTAMSTHANVAEAFEALNRARRGYERKMQEDE